MKRAILLVVCVAVLVATAGRVQAGIIIDTGTPSNGAPWTFSDVPSVSQYFSGQFSIGNAFTMNSIEGYLSNSFGGGTVDIAIHSNGGNVPGRILYTASVFLDNTVPL